MHNRDNMLGINLLTNSSYRNPRVTSDRALMHSGISVIAQCSHERRVNPPRRQWSSVRRSAEALLSRSERSVLCLLTRLFSSSSLSTQTDQECFGIPRFPPCISLKFHGSSPEPFVGTVYPPCSNYEKECSFGTRRGTHNGQQPLETIIDPRILL